MLSKLTLKQHSDTHSNLAVWNYYQHLPFSNSRVTIQVLSKISSDTFKELEYSRLN